MAKFKDLDTTKKELSVLDKNATNYKKAVNALKKGVKKCPKKKKTA